jgi:thiol-disulfide isomerase/thioredoxin
MRTNKIYSGKSGKRLKNLFRFCPSFFLLAIVSVCFQADAFAQTKKKTKTTVKKVSAKSVASDAPKVVQIDAAALTNLLKREGDAAKPLLVNFWATWCVPCVEEFPELVKIDADYKGKIDLITISLDDLAEINRDVPKFLAQMKASMPAYLLKTQNEEAAIQSVSKDWQGALPFTILFDAKGATVYIKQGKFKPAFLRNEIDKVLSGITAKPTE